MFERFTDRARRVLVLAQEEARLLNHSFIGTEHILLGLIHEGEGLAAKALESLGISLEAVREKVEETIGMAGQRADRLAAVHPSGEEGARALAARGAAARPQLHRHRAHAARSRPRGRGRRRPGARRASAPTSAGSASRSSSCMSGYQGKEAVGAGPGSAPRTRPTGSPVLDQFGRNLTQLARDAQARPGDRARARDRAGHAGAVPPHEEQPGADRRARRRQDRDRRGAGPADRRQRRPRDA